MNTNNFKSRVLDPLVKGLFSKIRRYNGMDTSEFYDNYKSYCIDFIKECNDKLENKNSNVKELQKEFVRLFFIENKEYEYFKYELDVSKTKRNSKKNIGKNGDRIRKSKDEIDKYNQLSSCQLRNELSQFTISLIHNTNKKLKIAVNDPEIAELIIQSYYHGTINYQYGSITRNYIPGEKTKLAIIDDGSYLHHIKKNDIKKIKKEIVESYVEYFKLQGSTKVLRFYPVHEKLGWACPKEQFAFLKCKKKKGYDFGDYQYTYIDDIHRTSRNLSKNKNNKIPIS